MQSTLSRRERQIMEIVYRQGEATVAGILEELQDPPSYSTVRALLRILVDKQHLQANEWWLAELAAKLSMPIATLHRWQRVGWVTARKVTAVRGRWAVYADADELIRLRHLRDSPRGWPQPYSTELITPKPKVEGTTAQP